MPNAKMDLLRDFQVDLLCHMKEDAARRIADVLATVLNNYEVTEACHDIIVPETESDVMVRSFLATKTIEGRSPKTIARYNDQIRKCLQTIRKPVKDITVYDLRSYIAHLSLRGLSANTANGVRSILSSFFSWLTNDGWLERNPAAQLLPIKCETIVKQPFTATDIDNIRSACDNLRDRAIVEFLYSTGCRISEAVALNVEDIDFRSMEVIVHGKGNKQRVVYLDELCCMHLRRYLSSRKISVDGGLAVAGKKQETPLFDGRLTDRITAHGVRGMLCKISDLSGVPNVHPHRFRHTLATNLALRGMPVQDIARILGHANIDTTMIYVNTSDANVKMSYRRFMA